MKNMSSFKKSVLSIVFMSAVTGSLISWDKYQPRHETQSLIEFYENRDLINHFAFLETIDYSNKNAALLTEEKRLIEAELMAQSLAENIYAREEGNLYSSNNIQETESSSTGKPLVEITKSDIITPLSKDKVAMENQNVEQPSKEVISEQVLFAFDSSEVEDTYLPLLNKTAEIMQDESIEDTKTWQVVGYADLTGNDIYNDKLAHKRAQSVTEYLVNKGVQEDKLIIVSLGESQAKQAEHNEENSRLARRVEIHDYDNLVATLSEQFNQQINEEIANIKKQALSQLKREHLAYQLKSQQQAVKSENQQKNIMATDIEKATVKSKPHHNFEFSAQQKDNMATLMKL